METRGLNAGMTQQDYISVESLQALIREPYGPPPGEEGTKLLHDRLDHVGQNVAMYVPGSTFGMLNEKHINLGHWDKMSPHLESGVLGNWMWLCAQFDEDAIRGVPTIRKDKVKVLFSVLHYLLNEEDPRGRYFRGVVEKTFEILDLGKPMNEQELFSNINQIATLANTPRRSFGKAH